MGELELTLNYVLCPSSESHTEVLLKTIKLLNPPSPWSLLPISLALASSLFSSCWASCVCSSLFPEAPHLLNEEHHCFCPHPAAIWAQSSSLSAVAAVPQVTTYAAGSGWVYVPNSWQDLLCHRLLGCNSADSPHFMLICFDSFQTSE